MGAVFNRDFTTLPQIPSRLESAPTELARLLAELPGQTARLFGREDEFKRLDAWHGHK